MTDASTRPGLSPADELRAAARAMNAEADRLDALDREASAGPWVIDTLYTHDDGDVPIQAATGRHICTSPDDGVRGGHDVRDADLIVHRRNTIVRDAAVLRATAELLRDSASDIDCAEYDRPPGDTSEITNVTALAVARAFTQKEADRV